MKHVWGSYKPYYQTNGVINPDYRWYVCDICGARLLTGHFFFNSSKIKFKQADILPYEKNAMKEGSLKDCDTELAARIHRE